MDKPHDQTYYRRSHEWAMMYSTQQGIPGSTLDLRRFKKETKPEWSRGLLKANALCDFLILEHHFRKSY
jgi:hypothetical protein